MFEEIECSIARWRQDQVRFAVVYIDLDGFGKIRNKLGSRQSDKFLKRIARGLVKLKEPGDTVARVGGDEFCLVLNNLQYREPVSKICTNLANTVSATPADNMHVSASIGSAICPDARVNASQLVRAAELAMNKAKMAGKNNSQQYRSDMDQPPSKEHVIQTELHSAIKHGHVIPYYQPKFSGAERRIAGAEALARWQQSKEGIIGPGHFMPVAEKYGLIIELERSILDRVCADIRRWLDSGLNVPPISVNMSAVRLRETDFAEQVEACLERHELPAEYLVFEITETVLMEDFQHTTKVLQRLNAIGIQMSLDDFGTGYSSLSYVTQLPAQQLKIDQFFISKLKQGNDDENNVVEFIIRLAHALRMPVVAEGVETQVQAAYLDELNCDELQGYLLSRPLTGQAFVARLQKSPAPGTAGVATNETAGRKVKPISEHTLAPRRALIEPEFGSPGKGN